MQAMRARPPGAGAVMWWASAVEARPEHLGVDVRPAGPCVLELLEHERRPAFGDDEAVSAYVEGPRLPAVDSAVMFAKREPTRLSPTGVIAASAPPVIDRVAPADWMRRGALPIACVADAHAVTIVSHGPRQPKRIEIAAAPAFAIIIGHEERRDPSRALFEETPICSCIV